MNYVDPTGHNAVGAQYAADGGKMRPCGAGWLKFCQGLENSWWRYVMAAGDAITDFQDEHPGTVEAAGVGLFVGGVADLSRAVASPLRFTQITASPKFSDDGDYAGKTIGEVAEMLRSGELDVSSVRVQYVVRNGTRLLINTRSSLALMRAGIDPSEWNMVDMTGEATMEAAITERLMNNGLTDEGTDVLRITGEGKNASSLR